MDLKKHYQNIIEYYDKSEIAYREGWDLNHSMALHGGYWDKKTKTFRQALARLNEVMSEIANVTPNEKVLDAGCGVGGSAIFLAKNFGCNVLGISLAEKQILKAQRNAEKNKVSQLVDFKVIDYTNTGLSSDSFDVVWAIESVCHALDKSDFVSEAFRILKPGGRLILADYFQKRLPNTAEEKEGYSYFLNFFACTHLDKVPLFEQRLNNEGFKNIESYNKTSNFLPNLPRLFFLGNASMIYSSILKLIGIKRRNEVKEKGGRASVLCAQFFKTGLMEYHVFCATK